MDAVVAASQALVGLWRRWTEESARTVDAQVLCEIEAGLDGIAEHLAGDALPGVRTWGVFDGGMLVGAAAVSHERHVARDRVGRLWGVYVLPRYRGTPASRLLMDSVLEACEADDGLQQLLAACAPDNAAGLWFLQRFGFEVGPVILSSDAAVVAQPDDVVYLRRFV